MAALRQRLRHASIGTKLAIIVALLQVAVLMGMAFAMAQASTSQLREATTHELKTQQDSVSAMLSLFDYSLQQQADRFLNIFSDQYSGRFALSTGQRVEVSGRQTPTLRDGLEVLNDNTWKLDRFSEQTGTPATIFARDGDDFVRIATSLKDENGKRAMGTLLNRESKSYAKLMANQPYIGLAKLFGTSYITKYQPIQDGDGKVVGALFVGVDISAEMAQVQNRIREMGIGNAGYTMLISAAGDHKGEVIAGGPFEGQNLLHFEAADAFVPLFDQASGEINYIAGDGDERLVLYARYPEWQWIIAGSVSVDEIEAGVVAARDRFLLIAMLLAAVLSLTLYWIAKWLVTKSMSRAVGLAQALAEGDLSQRIETRRRDEIGQLVGAMNGIGDGLERIVGQVRHAVVETESHTQELASGNAELSSRTESQAASLEQTAASTEEINATVRQNTQRAQESDEQTRRTVLAAGEALGTVEATSEAMQRIVGMAKQISEVVGVIDGIAFQTNLLALNASVEAARAGEHGRGFAVVAQEVRGLAERCSTSAQEIKVLIGHTVDEVDNGNLRAAEAGQRVSEIVSQVERISTLISEIRLASEEQSHGIEQINVAISQIDETTQSNAALVRQSSALTQQLNGQSRRLAETVSVFRLRDGSAFERQEPALSSPAASLTRYAPSEEPLPA
ncbi:HAMP domain-containing protein [Salinicola corii]|uniref:HAMP domain-containing protein n=1 Tax=Salinicola corii TaxID=2606937 RepID=A0A640WAD4_9GAMM|nr:Cache 3/Cache 2 fusion domain-containing protein [Salinicola corii]KAA0016256.1 HAMP domain-containing protein [Salinicola corii]